MQFARRRVRLKITSAGKMPLAELETIGFFTSGGQVQ